MRVCVWMDILVYMCMCVDISVHIFPTLLDSAADSMHNLQLAQFHQCLLRETSALQVNGLVLDDWSPPTLSTSQCLSLHFF